MSCILRVHCKCLINTCWINKNHFWLSGTIEAFAAAAAAKSLQSCLTLCDSIDGSPPGSPVPGILQARVLEWAAISFSNAWKWKVKMKSLSHAWLLATPWTAARQAPPPMGFSKQEYWSGLPLPWVCLKAHMKTTKGLGEVLDTQVLASYLETVTVHDASESVVLLEMSWHQKLCCPYYWGTCEWWIKWEMLKSGSKAHSSLLKEKCSTHYLPKAQPW